MPVRSFAVSARSTDVFGRVLVNARDQHIVIDGPVQNGCPGEAITPPEAFLASIAACGVELVHVIARAQGVALRAVNAEIHGEIDPDNRVREDVMVFNSVRLAFRLSGVSDQDASGLVEAFKGR